MLPSGNDPSKHANCRNMTEVDFLLERIDIRMIGVGICMILSRARIGLEIKMPFIICAGRRLAPLSSWSISEFRSLELMRAKSINVHLVGNH